MSDGSADVNEEGTSSSDEQEKENKKERTHRKKQLKLLRAAINQLDGRAEEVQKMNKQRKALLSHLKTFYSEMTLLAKAKGMSLMPVADLMVDQVNNAIADAKQLIEGDLFLDRVKPFVPAGNPPTYAEVLLVTKTVEEVLFRHSDEFTTRLGSIQRRRHEAETLVFAVEFAIENPGYSPSWEQTEEALGRTPDADWFPDDEEELFDFEHFDELDITAYFAETDDDASDDEENEDDDEDEEGEDERGA